MNDAIHNERKRAGLRQWQVAELLGINETVLSRKLRHELPEAEQNLIISKIRKYQEAQHDGK